MNKRFNDYLSSLTPKRRDIAQEAIEQFLKGESENVTEINSPTRIYNYFHDLALNDVECFEVLYLNHSFKPLKRVCIATGGITEVCVDLRIIFKEALLCNATQLVCAHNHPSGSIRPSRQDDILTQSIKKASEIMRIRLVDHVIIADGAYYSYQEVGGL